MSFRIGRTLPPAAAPIPMTTILRALPACFADSNRNDGVFEKEINEYCGSKHCFLLSSGKAALCLILTALKEIYPDRNEVLIPAFTCYSVPAAIKRAGLKIKLCDMGKDSLDFDKKQFQEIIADNKEKKTILCVLVTHLFGCPADFVGLKKIINSEEIPIVEDAAQAMGEELDDKKLGTLGDVGFFSLGRGKALSTQEGGVIITSQNDLAEKIRTLMENLPVYGKFDTIKLAIKTLLTNFLQNPYLFWLPKAQPFLKLGETIYEENFSFYKISSFQRELSRNWQERLAKHRKARIENIKFLLSRLPKSLIKICRGDHNSSLIRLPLLARTNEKRDWFIKLSEQDGLGIMPGYPTPINEVPGIAMEFSGQSYPESNDICGRLFTIPVHELTKGVDNSQLLKLLAENV